MLPGFARNRVRRRVSVFVHREVGFPSSEGDFREAGSGIRGEERPDGNGHRRTGGFDSGLTLRQSRGRQPRWRKPQSFTQDEESSAARPGDRDPDRERAEGRNRRRTRGMARAVQGNVLSADYRRPLRTAVCSRGRFQPRSASCVGGSGPPRSIRGRSGEFDAGLRLDRACVRKPIRPSSSIERHADRSERPAGVRPVGYRAPFAG